MIICAIKNEEKMSEGIIMLVIYNIINSIMSSLLNKSLDGSFLTGLEYSIMSSVFFGTSIMYFIIMFIRSLSQDKKQNTK